MREIWKLAWKLLLITAVAGFALGITNELTKDIIAAQAPSASEEAALVMPEASSFDLISEGEGGLDQVFCAYDGAGNTIGYVGTITTRGYGGEIVINVGLGMDGAITAINVGGENFNETVGLGAKVKEAPFMDQFKGLTPPLTLNQDVAAVTAATISSSAVTNAVNDATAYLAGLMG